MQIFFKVFKFKGFNNFKKGPRVGGGLGGPRKEGYGWGYIGRGFKGGFYKSGISLGFWDHLVPIFSGTIWSQFFLGPSSGPRHRILNSKSGQD